MEWSVHDVLLFGIFIALAIFAGLSAPSLWRKGWMPEAPGWWPYSDDLWRGLYRSVFVGTAGGVFLAVAFVVTGLWQASRPPAQQGLAAPLWAQIAVPGVLMAFLGMMLSVILVNRPKRVVPPSFRDQRGLLSRRGKARRTDRRGPNG